MTVRTDRHSFDLRIGFLSLCVGLMFLAASGYHAAAAASFPDSAATEVKPRAWTFSLSGANYLFPYDPDILMVVAMADRDQLHLEARYNYEALKTGSAFVGWNFEGGETVQFTATPMAGVAFGDLSGLIPALKLSVGYGIADFYAESEYVIDLNDSEGSFFYSWLELGFTPVDMFRGGGVAQRTRVVRTPLDLDRGIFAQFIREPATVSLYAFNLITEYWFLVAGVVIEF